MHLQCVCWWVCGMAGRSLRQQWGAVSGCHTVCHFRKWPLHAGMHWQLHVMHTVSATAGEVHARGGLGRVPPLAQPLSTQSLEDLQAEHAGLGLACCLALATMLHSAGALTPGTLSLWGCQAQAVQPAHAAC